MFSEVSVCPRGSPSHGGLCPEGCFCPGGLCPGGGVCLGGSLSRGSVLGGSLSRGSLSGRVSVRGGGGFCPVGSLSRRLPHTVTSGRYASYWNVFLLSFISMSDFFLNLKWNWVINFNWSITFKNVITNIPYLAHDSHITAQPNRCQISRIVSINKNFS